jgi:hypothetical protein
MSKKTTSRRSKSVDVPIYAVGEEKLVMFGWCSTKQHKDCVIEFTGHKCSCECHGEKIDE